MNSKDLVLKTKELCKREKELDAEIVRNLVQIYERNIYLDMNYGSLFAFCVGELGLCEPTAQRKVDAAMLAAKVPEIADKIEKGEISQSQVVEVARFLRNEKRHADKTFTKSEIKEIVEEVQETKSAYEAQKILMSKSEISQKPVAEKLKILPKGRQVLEIEVDDELLELLKEVEQLDSHLGYQPKAEHLKRVLKFYLSKKHPCHKKELSREKAPRHSEHENESSKKQQNPRYISRKLRQVVWQQHNGMCTFTDPSTGKRCESKFRLQIEHIIPVAYGGTADLDNLTLYCQAHNLHAARKAGLFHPNQQKELFN